MIRKIFLVACIVCNVVLVCTMAYAENKKILIIHITGSSGQEVSGLSAEEFASLQRVDKWVSQRLEDLTGTTRAYLSKIYPAYGSTAELNETDISLLKKEVFPKNDRVVLEIGMRYYGDVYKWTKENSYPNNVVKLFDVAGDLVARIVKEFRTSYPNSQIEGLAISIGSNVLLNAVGKGTKDFDRLLLIVPPIADESKFNKLLLNNGYNDKKVVVITAKNDKFAPLRLKGSSGFTLIEKVD